MPRGLQAFLKPFAASVTGFAYSYQRDLFYRTSWNIVLLQIVFAAIVVIVAVASLSFLYDNIVGGLIQAITRSIATGIDLSADTLYIASSLEYEKQKYIVLTAAGIIVAAAIFSWFIAITALRPAQNALDSQKQFVRNIAHELRTPLSIIKTNTEVALFNEKLDGETRETLSSNLEELERISDTINNLLSMNALLNPERMAVKSIEVEPVIERVVRSLASLADEKRVEIIVTKDGHRTVRGNVAALEQILMNIIKNAVHYSRPGGTVYITTRHNEHDQVELEVKDTGIGIPALELSHVFEPFYRGDRARTRRTGVGSGLGLAIVGELVRAHKGRVRISSTEGTGTSVIVSLPRGDQTLSHAQPTESPSSVEFH